MSNAKYLEVPQEICDAMTYMWRWILHSPHGHPMTKSGGLILAKENLWTAQNHNGKNTIVFMILEEGLKQIFFFEHEPYHI